MTIPIDSIICGDALTVLRTLPDGCVDAIITDPPYGTTGLAFDKPLDWPLYWPELSRIVSQRGAIVMTAQNPFASELITSNRKMFRYEWVWEKSIAPNFVNANIQPLRCHEQVLVFSHSLAINGAHADRLMNYYPQMDSGTPFARKYRGGQSQHYHGVIQENMSRENKGTRYPRSVIRFSNGNNASQHPTQKPLTLMDYLIRTYTREGDLVLDPFAGSGTTLVAAKRLSRHYLGVELNPEYAAIAERRLAEPFTLPMVFGSEAAP